MSVLKKIAVLGIMGIMSAGLLTGCGSDVEGKWKLSEIKTGDQVLTAEEYMELLGEDTEVSIEFKDDGMAVLNVVGKREEIEYDDSEEVLINESGTKIRYDEKNDKIVVEESDAMMTFEREKD